MKAFFSVAILSTITGLSFGLRCYNCLHSTYPSDNDKEGIQSDPSCKDADPKHIEEFVSCFLESGEQKYDVMRKTNPHLKFNNFTSPTNGKQASRVSCIVELRTDGEHEFTRRSCSNVEGTYCETLSNTDGIRKTCVCNTDECNKHTLSALASNISIPPLNYMLAVAITIFACSKTHLEFRVN